MYAANHAIVILKLVSETLREASQAAASLREDGYYLAPSLLDANSDIMQFKQGFGVFLDDLSLSLSGDAGHVGADGTDSAIASEFAVLLGSIGGDLLDHIDPVHSSLRSGWRWRPDFPAAQFRELFILMRNLHLLNLLEGVLGGEIVCSPNYHFNIKLGARDRARARRGGPKH